MWTKLYAYTIQYHYNSLLDLFAAHSHNKQQFNNSSENGVHGVHSQPHQYKTKQQKNSLGKKDFKRHLNMYLLTFAALKLVFSLLPLLFAIQCVVISNKIW